MRLLEGLGDFLFVASPGLERGAGLYLEASPGRWTRLPPLRVLTPGLLLLCCPSCVFQAGALGSSAPEIVGILLGHVHPSLGSMSQNGLRTPAPALWRPGLLLARGELLQAPTGCHANTSLFSVSVES